MFFSREIKPSVLFIGGFWMGKSDIVYQMYKALKDVTPVMLLNTDQNKEMLDCGSNGYDYGTSAPIYLNNIAVNYVLKIKPDIVICCAGGLSFKKEDLKYLHGIKIIGIALSDPDVFNLTTSIIAKNFDIFYTNAISSLSEYKKIGINAKLLPFAANPKFHKKTKPKEKYKTDVLLIGNYRPDRVDIIKKIQKDFKLTIFGDGWEVANIRSRGHIEGREMIRAINSAKICLDFPRTLAGYDNVKIRIFEYGCCGALVFTGKIKEMEKYFKYNHDLIGYNNYKDLKEKINFFLNNSEDSEMVRSNIYNKCLSEHTWQKRWQGVLNDAKRI